MTVKIRWLRCSRRSIIHQLGMTEQDATMNEAVEKKRKRIPQIIVIHPEAAAVVSERANAALIGQFFDRPLYGQSNAHVRVVSF